MRSNVVLELGTRLLQPEEEWRDKCAAFTELRRLLALLDRPQDAEELFAPENVQALTQPFRVTVADLRSTVVKEACATLSLLAQTLGPIRCKILVRDVFPTLLDARGGSNKVNTAAVHSCIEAIVDATPSRFVLAPVLQVLDSSKNREVRESCIHYTHLALERWNSAVLERFRIPLRQSIATSLSDASPKGREKARDCYWKYISIWPDEVGRINTLLTDGVKKHLKRSRKQAGLDSAHQPSKRRHLATITNTISSKSAPKSLFTGEDAVKKVNPRLTSRSKFGIDLGVFADKKMTPTAPDAHASLGEQFGKAPTGATVQPSRIPSTPTSALKKPREGKIPSKLPTPQHLTSARTMAESTATSTYLEGKFAQLQDEKALLDKKLEAQAQELQRLQERIQMMNEEKEVSEARYKDAMKVTMATHAENTATQQEIQYKLAEQVASQEDELEELRSQHSPAPPSRPTHHNDEQVTQLEKKVSSLVEQLQAATVKLEASTAEAGDEVSALQSEKGALEERLSAQSTQLEELQAQQVSAVAALEEEKRVLASEVSSLKSGQSEAMAQCNEKDERVAELEKEVSSLAEQLQAATAKLEASTAEAGDEVSALQSEKGALEERLSAQSTQLEELQAQQVSAVAALEEEKRVLASEVSSLKSGQSEAMAQCNGNEENVWGKIAHGGDCSEAAAKTVAVVDGSVALSDGVDKVKTKPIIPVRAFSLAFVRDRSEIEDEERRINEANLLKRRLRRQNRQR